MVLILRLFLPFFYFFSFMSTLLPPTPETLQHVLTQGGIPAWLATAHDPTFDAFLSETRTHVASGSFERVLEVCLDRATDVLLRGVEKHIFGSYHEQEDIVLGGQEPRERLAAMLPGLARWCHLALEGLPNELVDVRRSLHVVSLPLLTSLGFHVGSCGRQRSRCAFGNNI